MGGGVSARGSASGRAGGWTREGIPNTRRATPAMRHTERAGKKKIETSCSYTPTSRWCTHAGTASPRKRPAQPPLIPPRSPPAAAVAAATGDRQSGHAATTAIHLLTQAAWKTWRQGRASSGRRGPSAAPGTSGNRQMAQGGGGEGGRLGDWHGKDVDSNGDGDGRCGAGASGGPAGRLLTRPRRLGGGDGAGGRRGGAARAADHREDKQLQGGGHAGWLPPRLPRVLGWWAWLGEGGG